MTESFLAAGFLTLYAQPLAGLDLLAKSAKQKVKEGTLKIVNPERDKHGRPDYHAVPIGHSVWVEIDRPGHALHRQHVLVTKTTNGFRIANQLPPEQVRGTRADVQRRRALLANYSDEQRRKKDKEAARKLKDDSANDPFVVLAGGKLPQTRVIQSPWPDEDEVVKSLAVSMGLTLAEKPQDARNGHDDGIGLEKAHDVSGEPRDEDGKWTKGGGSKFAIGPAEHVAPFIGDVYKVAGRSGTFRLSDMTLHSVVLRNDKGDEIPIMYPETWDNFARAGIIQLLRSVRDDPTPEKWQKTRAQFKAENPRDAWQHENAVFNALVDGKPVPDEVLKDYPDLKQKAKHFNFDSEVRENPQPGNEVRVVNPESPDYGRIFRVVGQRITAEDDQNDYPGTKCVQLVKLDKNNKNPVNLPFEMPLTKWKDLFPYRAMGDNLPGPYADALPEKWEELPSSFDYTLAAHLDGDRDLPDPTGRKIDHIALGPSDLADAQAKARKARVAKNLADVLANNKDFSAYAERIGRDADTRIVQSKTFTQLYVLQAQDRLDNPTDKTKRQRLESATSNLISAWASTSADSSDLSLGIQRATAEVFGLNLNETRLPWLSGGGIKNSVDKDSEIASRKDYQQNGAAYRAFVQAQYDATQHFFQRHHIKNVMLYRGFDSADMRVDRKRLPSNGETVTLEMQPLSSFSTDKGIADTFGRTWNDDDGRVLVAKVPATDIVATALTGSGCLVEREAIVLGKPLVAKIYGVARSAVRLHGGGGEDAEFTHLWDDGEFNKSNDLLRSGTIHVDERLRNADWTKTTWDLPPLHSPAMRHLMYLQGKKSLYDLRGLPVWQAYVQARQRRKGRRKITKSHDVSGEPRDKHGRWTNETGLTDILEDTTLNWQPGINPGDLTAKEGHTHFDYTAATHVLRWNTYTDDENHKLYGVSYPRLSDEQEAKLNAKVKQKELPKQPPKEDWKLTKDEFRDKYYYQGVGLWRHKNIVAKAIAEGKDVPERVLAEYPEIQQDLPRKKRDLAQLKRVKPGDEFVVSDERIPQYGLRFRVLGIEKSPTNENYVKLVGKYPGGSIVPPFLVPQNIWESMLPDGLRTVLGQRSDSFPLQPYRAGESAPLPPPAGDINYYANEKFYNQVLGKPQKIRTMGLIANRLLNNAAFQQEVTRVATAHAEVAIQSYQAHAGDMSRVLPDEIAEYHAAKKFMDYRKAHNGEIPLAEKKIYTQRRVASLVDSWANSSADNDFMSVNLQRAVDEEFNLHSTYKPWLTSDTNGGSTAISDDTTSIAAEEYQKTSPAYRAFVRAEYDATQELFRHLGIKTINLYRGITLSDERFPGATDDWKRIPGRGNAKAEAKVYMQPASSFATSLAVANDFANGFGNTANGAILQTRVPVERILSTPMTGSGCLHERECIVLGGEPLVGTIERPTMSFVYRDQIGESDSAQRLWSVGPASAMQLPGAESALNVNDYLNREGQLFYYDK